MSRAIPMVCVIASVLFSIGLSPAQIPIGGAPDNYDWLRFGPVGDDASPISSPLLFPRDNYSWPYTTGPYYGDVPLPSRFSPKVMRTAVGSFDLPSRVLPFPGELIARVRLDEIGAQYFIVQTEPDLERIEAFSREIERVGGVIVETISRGTLIARLDAAAFEALGKSPDMHLVEPYHPALKLHPRIGRDPLPDPFKALSEVYELDVLVWPGEETRSVADLVAKLGGSSQKVGSDQLRVELHRSLLPQLAALEPVKMVYEHLPVFLHGEETTTTVQTGEYNEGAAPFHDAGLTGHGGLYCDDANFGSENATTCETHADCVPNPCRRAEQILMVLDSGIQLDAADLADTRVSAGVPGPTHRKVIAYQSVAPLGGQGDLIGCDAPAQGGHTHGHMVAATALGNATDVSGGYGMGWEAFDRHGNAWALDGLAPHAKLIAYDAQVTPPVGACGDPQEGDLVPGDLYDPSSPSNSSLGAAYQAGARVFNLSWGVPSNVYNADSSDVDRFMAIEADALVVVSVGNRGADLDPPGGDGTPDPQTMSAPGTSKNALAVGASRNADRFGAAGGREFFSATGPAVNDTTVNRIAPQVMAPGGERGGGSMGISSEFACGSSDNDGVDPVECGVASGREGTSFSAAAASGAAMLVRDYFSQGFYPRGFPVSADQVPTISGALAKGVLVASAEFMTGSNLTKAYRWNNEQGAGRIQLDNALPVESWPRSPTGMLVHDTIDGQMNVSNLSLPATLSFGGSASADFEVCNDTEELRIVLSWTDPQNQSLRNNLDLSVTAPSGKTYLGNYYTDDNNRNGVLDATPEDCPGIGERVANGRIDEGPWSLAVCPNSRVPGFSNTPRLFDETNVVESVMLSPDPDGNGGFHDGSCSASSSDPTGLDGNGTCGNDLDCAVDPVNPLPSDECVGGTQQPEVGEWKITISAGTPFTGPVQDFAVVISGGACLGASVRFDQESYTCNEAVQVIVNELTPAVAVQVTDRTTIRVLDPVTLAEVDCEGLGCAVNPMSLPLFLRPNPDKRIFESPPIVSTAAKIPAHGDRQLDVRDGQLLQVTYDDGTTLYTSTATVDCRLDLDSGSVVFSKFGKDESFLIDGGCERAAPRHERCEGGFCSGSGGACSEDLDCPLEVLGFFEYGHPDQYMDPDELVHYHFAFNADETADLTDVWADLRCVRVDSNSPPTCRPNGDGCQPGEDPTRMTNVPCPWMTVLDSPKRLGYLPAGAALSANFTIQMRDDSYFANDSPTVELLLDVWDDVSGMSAGLLVSRHRLNVDPVEFLYSTDFPVGGIQVEVRDYDNNEREQNPTSAPGVGVRGDDYRFETVSFSDMTSTGRNLHLLSPWNFDGNDGGFTYGLAAATDRAAAGVFNISNWGEDRNFNRIEDGVCRFDPSIACYSFPFDARCPGPGNCDSVEDSVPGTPLHRNWNTLGGCGWQTRAPHTCTANSNRSCFIDDDCLGECRLFGNEPLSTFTPCSGASGCPPVLQCNAFTSTMNILGPCISDVDCGGTSGSCQAVSQICMFFDGVCDLLSANLTGGIWHTGTIGFLGQPCPDECEPYDVIPTTGSHLMWWELLLTPVMEKVDLSVDSWGEPEAQVEITRWAWNQSIDLADEYAAVTWEFDTDVSTPQEADLINDSDVLGLSAGPYGSLSGANNSQLTEGYGLFAPMATCFLSGAPCVKDRDCPPGACSVDPTVECYVDFECISQNLGACVGADHCVWTGVSSNGAVGSNRVGRNACTFLGTAVPPDARERIAVAGPLDDDLDNDGDGFVDEFVTDNGPLRNWDVSAFNGPDMRDVILEDIYGDTGEAFQGAIGFVNFEGNPGEAAAESYGLGVDDVVVEWKEITLDLDQTSCADGACATIELTTTNFFEGTAVAEISVLEWTPYGSVCVGGPDHARACFPAQGNSCPGGGTCIPFAVNDCDLNGTYFDPGDDDNCDNDIFNVPDIVVLATSDADVDGEIVVLNRTGGPWTPEYRGEVPVSLWVDNPGVLFLNVLGDRSPTVNVRYFDADDGAGNPCQDDVLAEYQGHVQTATTLFAETCDVGIVDYHLVDYGDGDGIADTSERVELELVLHNRCERDLSSCVAWLHTDSPEIEYIQNRTQPVGFIPADAKVPLPIPFLFRVADWADRTSLGLTPDDDLSAEFTLTLVCNEIAATSIPQLLDLQLDYNLWDLKQASIQWVENFSSATLGKFIPEDLDHGLPGTSDPAGLSNSDGWRCQYSDPDRPGSNSYGTPAADDCYPGMNVAHSIAVFWQPDGTTTNSPDGGRAKSGNHSMYYGQYLGSGFTTPMAVVESVRSTPINLGVDDPSFSFWHQISLTDYRSLGSITPRRSADRAVVQIRRLDGSSQPVSDWTTLRPTQNGYDEQAADFFFNCSFDPPDDGTTEDDFFDLGAPRLGPSSTCFPAMTFGYLGDTDGNFDPSSIGHATTAPKATDAPSLGVGTWVESSFDLSQYRGRRVEVRFLVSALKSTAENWAELFEHDPTSADDGWWIDDVVIDETLAIPAQVWNDDFPLGTCSINGDACIGQCRRTPVACTTDADCGGNEDCVAPCPAGQVCVPPPPLASRGSGLDVCTVVEANVFVEPEGEWNPGSVIVPAPGQTVYFDAASPVGPSVADACLNGTLRFRHCISADPDGLGPQLPDEDCDDEEDRILRGWTDDPTAATAPLESSSYVLEVRCSTAHDCRDSRKVDLIVGCGDGPNGLPLLEIEAVSKTTLAWTDPLDVDWLKGDFVTSADIGAYVPSFYEFGAAIDSIPMKGTPTGSGSDAPAAGNGWYYLVKMDGEITPTNDGVYCNSATWRSGGPAEKLEPARDIHFGNPTP